MEEPVPHTLILGLGNPLRGDDGVGTAVITALQSRTDLPAGIVLHDGGTPGLETALLLEPYQRVIIIDAADMGLEPGEWTCCTPEDVMAAQDSRLRGTLHTAGLPEALELAEALGILPAQLVIYGVQPATVAPSLALSEAVEAAIPAICQDIVELNLEA